MRDPLTTMSAKELESYIRGTGKHAAKHGPDEPPLIVTARGRVTRQRTGGPIVLTTRMIRMIDLIVNGMVIDGARAPCDPFEAGRLVGYQRRAVRRLAMSPVIIAAYEAARVGADPAHLLPTFDELRRDARRRDATIAVAPPVTATPPRPASGGYVIQLRHKDAGVAA